MTKFSTDQILKYTTAQRFGIVRIFLQKALMLTRAAFIWLNIVATITLWNIITIWNECNLYLWWYVQSLLLTSMSHDPSEIIQYADLLLIFYWSPTQLLILVLIIINVNIAAYYFCGNHYTFFQDSLMKRKFKRTAFIWNRNLTLLSLSINIISLFFFYLLQAQIFDTVNCNTVKYFSQYKPFPILIYVVLVHIRDVFQNHLKTK